MNRCTQLLGIGIMGTVLGTEAFAQTGRWNTYANETAPPLEDVLGTERRSDIDITGSIQPAPVNPGYRLPQGDVRVTLDNPGCEVQSYGVSPTRRVRVHRC